MRESARYLTLGRIPPYRLSVAMPNKRKNLLKFKKKNLFQE